MWTMQKLFRYMAAFKDGACADIERIWKRLRRQILLTLIPLVGQVRVYIGESETFAWPIRFWLRKM